MQHDQHCKVTHAHHPNEPCTVTQMRGRDVRLRNVRGFTFWIEAHWLRPYGAL